MARALAHAMRRPLDAWSCVRSRDSGLWDFGPLGLRDSGTSGLSLSVKPAGVAAEVRTYGQFVVHLINANNSYCARAKGEQAKAAMDEKGTFSKADLVKQLNESLSYCDTAYAALTASNAAELMTVQGRGGSTQIARANPLISNLGHNWEHYGNLVTYLRAKGIVPPSSDR